MKKGLALVLLGLAVVAIAIAGWWYVNNSHAPVETQGTPVATSTDVPFSVLAAGADAKEIHSRTNYAIYDKGEFATFWKKAHGTDTEALPTVDFSKNYVIAVFGGDMPTGGSKVSIERISDSGDARSVAVVLEESAPDCSATKVGTNPYIFVSVPFSDAQNLAHTDRVVVNQCTQS